MCWPPRIVHPKRCLFSLFHQNKTNTGTPLPPSLTSTKQTICFLSLELASRHLASRHLSSKITPPTLPDRSRKPYKEKEDRFFYVLLFITKIQKKNFRLISLEFGWVGGIVHTFVTHFMISRDPEYCPQPKQDNDQPCSASSPRSPC